MYEIQQSLRQLSYFNITGRLKLTLQLARVTINIPLAIDQAMKTGAAGDEERGGANGEADEYSSSSSDSEAESETDHTPASHQPAEEAHFGISPEDGNYNDNDDGDDGDDDHSTAAEERARARRRAKRARRRAAKREKRAKLRGAANGSDASQQHSSSSTNHQQQQLQRRGLLPQTAVGLLKGVAMVLETSESWMPGGGVASNAPS